MVAYNIPPQWRGPIRRGEMQQMVCAVRLCNPRVGDTITLYGGMVGRQRAKLIRQDPVCTEALPVLVNLDPDHAEIIDSIKVGGSWLRVEEIEGFCAASGFAENYLKGSARWRMGDFLQSKHGFEVHQLVLIKWEPR